MKFLLLSLLLVMNPLFSQKGFHKNIYLPEQNKLNSGNGSLGLRIACFNGSLYSICKSSSYNSSSKYTTDYLHFIKYNLNGDTQFSKLIYFDSLNWLSNISYLTLNEVKNGFNLSYSTQKSIYFTKQITQHQINIDTLGKVISRKNLVLDNDSSTEYTGIVSSIIDDSTYSVIYQFKDPDTLTSLLVRWENGIIKDTLIKFNDAIVYHSLINLSKLKNNTFAIFENQKVPQVIPYKGKSFICFYDSSFKLLKRKELNGYWSNYDIKAINDTLIIMGYNSYSIASSSLNYVRYSINMMTLNGDSIYEWNSNIMRMDTASNFNTLLILKNEYYLCSQKFLFKLHNDSLIVIKDMRKILPNDYCFVNDSSIGFTGGINKISNIGIINSEGKFSNIRKTFFNVSDQISLYPNPSNQGILYLNGIHDEYNIGILNSFGQVVFTKNRLTESRILTDLNPGIYFIQLNYKNNVYVLKWIIQ